eukprot:CAMPEP_0176224376 /NCGR_PEP_ID=MMETSP0121_2-20121125/21222_1 /TAXON_ID=160619 /ORGANISM="Kryptoperidinium foliaceum, Strain CCMP 1326" /LENGTH=146 /DNA_ID=CAMNT_0017563627 /DNA_START=59 /DNA_END=497 /DNA_ORIENTATION=-
MVVKQLRRRWKASPAPDGAASNGALVRLELVKAVLAAAVTNDACMSIVPSSMGSSAACAERATPVTRFVEAFFTVRTCSIAVGSSSSSSLSQCIAADGAARAAASARARGAAAVGVAAAARSSAKARRRMGAIDSLCEFALGLGGF